MKFLIAALRYMCVFLITIY